MSNDGLQDLKCILSFVGVVGVLVIITIEYLVLRRAVSRGILVDCRVHILYHQAYNIGSLFC